uniref:TNF receptor superfamily member 25 n=1 Tax=Molossus molossus TaxID=27622 RepID=A0A7J8FD05_MOLMO|nr:TNF receptor superfamily member 25 [Molossus molossus]
MERRPRGSAVAAAAALLLLLLLGTQGQGSTPSPRCDCAHNFQKRNSQFCCGVCPAASQVALENCSAVSNTRCGCKPGWFVECLVAHCIGGSPFHCQPCRDCEALHRHTRVPCHPPLIPGQCPDPSGATQRQ